MPIGVALWSLATAFVPVLAGTIPGLCFSRALVGLGEGVAPSAAVDITSKTAPKSERSRSISFIFNGLNVGSIVGLILAPIIIKQLGWESVFVVFGVGGLLWTLWFTLLSGEMDFPQLTQQARQTDEQEGNLTVSSRSTQRSKSQSNVQTSTALTSPRRTTSGGLQLERLESERQNKERESTSQKSGVPFRAFLRSTPVRALMFTHYCHNWFHYTMLAWLPTYFSVTLGMDIMHAAQVSLFPPITSFFIAATTGTIADGMIKRGMPTGQVRKLCQTLAFLGPAILLSVLAFSGEDLSVVQSVGLVALSLGISSFSLVGLYCTHGDMSSKYSSVLLGLTNTSGALPGIIGVAFVGQILDLTHSWQLALFAPCIFFFLAGALVYGKYSSSDP